MAGQAKVHINLREGTFEAEGSEEFVKAQLKAYDKEIRQSLAKAPAAPPPPPPGGPGTGGGGGEATGDAATLESLSDVLEVDEGTTHIIGNIQGTSGQDKMRKVALLYLYGAYLSGRRDMIPHQEIRDACTQQGCLDSPNYLKALKRAKEHIVVDKNGARLTTPGRKAAHVLAEQMKPSG